MDLTVIRMPSTMASNHTLVTFVIKHLHTATIWPDTDVLTVVKDLMPVVCVFWCSLNLARSPITNVSMVAINGSLVTFVINHFPVGVMWWDTNVFTTAILNVCTTVTHVNRWTKSPPLTKHTLLTNHMNVMCVIRHLGISAILTVTKMPSTFASNHILVTFVIKHFHVQVIWPDTNVFIPITNHTSVMCV